MSEPWTEPAPGPEEPEFVPLSHRQGVGEGLAAWPELVTETWRRRHLRGLLAAEPDRRFRCRCPGWTDDARQVDCGERANADDLLCRSCRRWCCVLDDLGLVTRPGLEWTYLQLFGQNPRRSV